MAVDNTRKAQELKGQLWKLMRALADMNWLGVGEAGPPAPFGFTSKRKHETKLFQACQSLGVWMISLESHKGGNHTPCLARVLVRRFLHSSNFQAPCSTLLFLKGSCFGLAGRMGLPFRGSTGSHLGFVGRVPEFPDETNMCATSLSVWDAARRHHLQGPPERRPERPEHARRSKADLGPFSRPTQDPG